MNKFKKRVSAAISSVMAVTMAVSGLNPLAVSATDDLGQNGKVQQFYVAANGKDSNDGSAEHPFATLEKAREAVDAVNDDMQGDIVVNIAPGDYYIDETIQFTTNDSGTNGYEIIYRCTGKPGSARLIGGEKISGWTLADESDVTDFDMPSDMVGKVYKHQLDPEKYNFNTMYVDGKRATMARTLNRENNPRFPMSDDTYMLATAASSYSISYPKNQLPQSAVDGIKNAIDRGEEGAQVYGWDWDYRNWFTSTIPITGINTSTGTLSFTPDPEDPTKNRPKFDFGAGARFYLQGNLSFLDTPGEYHYNKSTGVLYYYPEKENLEEQEVIVPVLQEIIHIEGEAKAKLADKPDPDKMVHNITFEGLQAGYTEFTDSYSSGWNSSGHQSTIREFPKEALEEGITNPSYCEQTERPVFQKGVFHLKQTHDITLDKMQIVNAGMIGVVVWKDNNDITIKNSEIAHSGLFGINIDGGYPGPEAGKYSYNHLVTNNVIHDVGELVGHGTGIQILQVHDSEFSHMEMYNATRRAIFLQGGWDYRHKEDQAMFNRYRDSATYENHLEYLYLHDLQQDGGDDGAIFFCTLYRFQGYPGNGRNETKPNYLNQVYMDRVGAASSTDDFTPNCINFDMGCGGVVASNIKTVNPQHYGVRYNEGQGEVTFDNVNMAYYHPMADSNYTNFDDSKMEYDKIGVDASFPYPEAVTTMKEKSYEDVYYREEFDNGLNDWWSLTGKPGTSPVYYSDRDEFGKDNNSFLADAYYGGNNSNEGCTIGKPFGTNLNKVVEIDFFDHTSIPKDNGYCGMGFQYKINSFARVDDGILQRAIGADYSVSSKYYVYKLGSVTKMTDVPREYGWHTFKWDYTDGKTVKMYIDGKEIATAPAEHFNYVEMGNYNNGFNAYDNVVIYGGNPAEAPIPLPEPPKPEAPEAKVFPGRVEAENADSRSNGTQIVDGASGGQAVGYLSIGSELTYHITALEDVEMPLTVLYAANGSAGFKLLVDGEEQLDVNLPRTGGWDKFKEIVTSEKLTITEGEHILKIQVTANNFNLDSFGLLKEELPPEPVKVKGVKTSVKDTLVLGIGNTVKIPVLVLPENADNKALVWTTDDTEGAVISLAADGTITAKNTGKAKVTVASSDNPDAAVTFEVEVKDVKEGLISKTENGCKASANVPSEGGEKYDAWKLIDGSVANPWVPAGNSGAGHLDQPSCYLEWDTPQTVETIRVYNRQLYGFYASKFQVIIDDDKENPLVYDLPEYGMTEIQLPEPRVNVNKIEVQVLEQKNIYGNSGFGEIEVYDSKPGEIPVNSVAFANDEVKMMKNSTFTLIPPAVVPSTATDNKLNVTVVEGTDVIRLQANATDGVVKNYTITSLKEGTAVIRATASNGVYSEVKVTIGSREALGEKIIEAEYLYAKYIGTTEVHKAFKEVIDKAVGVYNSSTDVVVLTEALEKLDAAMKQFEDVMLAEVPVEERIFTITVDGKSETYKYNAPVTITASVKDGKKFAGWESDGKIISYGEIYKFYVSKNMTFTARYVKDTEEVVKEELEAQAILSNVFVTKRADEKSDVKFVGELSLPEGYTILEAGLVWSSKDTALVDNNEPNKALKPTMIKKISDTNQFSVTIKGMPKDKFIRGVIFAKVEDKNGKQSYLFSDETKVFAAQ